MELTQARVRELFDYRDDGSLIRKTRQSSRAMPGKVVGCLHAATGYLVVRVEYKLYKVHRLIFLWHHGHLPAIVDHIDMDRLNNRIENLRTATKSQNMSNRLKQSNNTSGYKGVYFQSQIKRWCAEIHADGKKTFLGTFDSAEEAHAAYVKAAESHHGEFARAA